MTADPMEILLAQLLASPSEVEQFLQDREKYSRDRGLTPEQTAKAVEIDAAALRFAARSFERKRAERAKSDRSATA
jgi:hypothetical protein